MLRGEEEVRKRLGPQVQILTVGGKAQPAAVKCRFNCQAGIVRPTTQEAIATKKIACYTVPSRRGHGTRQHAGPHGKVPELVERQRR
jgi:hypothetical protein